MGEKQGHTPGPWSHDYRKTVRNGMAHEVFDGTGELIATVAWYPVKLNDTTTTTNREANARLIAAAPDLLEALIDARSQLEVYEREATGEAYNDLEINAAIAKATGATDAQ
jgi:hypothetical protein